MVNMKTMVRELREAMYFIGSLQYWRMAVFWTISILVSYWQLFTQRMFSWQSFNYPRCEPTGVGSSKPLCIITGATSGLGYAAAEALSREGFFVVLVGRSSSLLVKAMEEIRERNEGAHLRAFEVDLSSFQSILKFRISLEKWLLDSEMHCSIQLLINNAGILATSLRFTSEGYDKMMGTNYIGAFHLSNLLLPLLRNSPVGSRIVNVTSFTHRSVFDVQVHERSITGNCFLNTKQYPYAQIYEYSKLCLLLFSYELHRQLHMTDKSCQVSVNAADPGVVETNIMREVPSFLSKFACLVLKLLGVCQSPEHGVSSILDAALAPQEISGEYFFGGKGRTLNSSALSQDTKLAEKLWTASCNLFQQLELACRGT